jgi:DNA-binding transcriptional regulator YiaG
MQYKNTDSLETYNRLYQQQQIDKENGNKTSQATELYNQMKALNKQIKAIREDTKLSSQDKKDQISALRAEQRKVGDQAIRSGVIRNR